MNNKRFQSAYSIVFSLLLFLFVYDCYFIHFSYTTNIIFAVIGLLIFPFYIFILDNINKNSVSCFILYIVMIAFSFFVMFINGSKDMSFLKNELLRNVFFPFFSAFFIAWIANFNDISFKKMCNYIVNVSIVQCVIIFLCFFNKEFKEIIISIQFISERELNILNAGIRSVGLGTRFDFGAFTMSYIMLISIYLYLANDNKDRNKYLWIWVIQLLAGMFLARSIVLGVLGSALLLLLSTNSVVTKIKSSFKIIMIVFASVITVLILYPALLERYSKTFNWMFQYFNNSSNLYDADTLSKLSNDMYFLPKVSTLFLGDGMFTTNDGYAYMYTDPLIMRYLLYWGIPGLSLFVFFTALNYKKLSNVQKIINDNHRYDINFSLFIKIAFLIHILMYFKLNYHMFKFVYLFIWVFVFESKKLVERI